MGNEPDAVMLHLSDIAFVEDQRELDGPSPIRASPRQHHKMLVTFSHGISYRRRRLRPYENPEALAYRRAIRGPTMLYSDGWNFHYRPMMSSMQSGRLSSRNVLREMFCDTGNSSGACPSFSFQGRPCDTLKSCLEIL